MSLSKMTLVSISKMNLRREELGAVQCIYVNKISMYVTTVIIYTVFWNIP